MIAHAEFAKLRLAQFLPEKEISELEDWEFEGRVWVGEAIGFCEWLRPVEAPNNLCSLAIDFAAIPLKDAGRILTAIQLPLAQGMTRTQIQAELGVPVKEYRFVPDRVTVEFSTPNPDSYQISCTVLNNGGLTHLVVMVREP